MPSDVRDPPDFDLVPNLPPPRCTDEVLVQRLSNVSTSAVPGAVRADVDMRSRRRRPWGRGGRWCGRGKGEVERLKRFEGRLGQCWYGDEVGIEEARVAPAPSISSSPIPHLRATYSSSAPSCGSLNLPDVFPQAPPTTFVPTFPSANVKPSFLNSGCFPHRAPSCLSNGETLSRCEGQDECELGGPWRIRCRA